MSCQDNNRVKNIIALYRSLKVTRWCLHDEGWPADGRASGRETVRQNCIKCFYIKRNGQALNDMSSLIYFCFSRISSIPAAWLPKGMERCHRHSLQFLYQNKSLTQVKHILEASLTPALSSSSSPRGIHSGRWLFLADRIPLTLFIKHYSTYLLLMY